MGRHRQQGRQGQYGPHAAGSFVAYFGKQVHWDGAKDEEAWVLIVGEGPGTLTLVEEAK